MEKPPMRILQRPCKVSVSQPTVSTRPASFVKTLRQKKEDYAAARRRILGSECSETEEEEDCILKALEDNDKVWNSSSAQFNSADLGDSLTSQPLRTDSNPGFYLPGRTSTKSMPTRGRQITPVTTNQRLSANGMCGITQLSRGPLVQQPFSSQLASPSFPMFASQSNMNTGLLPTPPGFNYGLQSAGTALQQRNAATALSIMHLISQQHQTNSMHNNLVPPIVHNPVGAAVNFPFGSGGPHCLPNQTNNPTAFN